MGSFQDIIAWQKGYKFVLSVYRVTNHYPVEERFGLMSQFRRAAVSIPANIAEGYKKMGKADKLRLMNVGQGSLEECRTYVLLSKDLGYISSEEFALLVSEIEEASKTLNAYCKAIARTSFGNEL